MQHPQLKIVSHISTFLTQQLPQQLTLFTLLILLSATQSCTRNPTPQPAPADHGLRGTDFSQLPKIEQSGYTFYTSDSLPADPLAILQTAGLNLIRLKVWNNPTGDASLEELLPYAQRIKDQNLQLMLTLHYSNTWADPGAQSVPSQWASLPFDQLLDSVEAFTYRTVKALQPQYVQIGNEINHGLMHPFGVRDGSGNFQKILQAGINGAHRADSNVITLLHYAGYDGAQNFFAAVDSLYYDAMGLSYYPKWHGTSLVQLATTINSLKSNYFRPLHLVETSYAFTLSWNDWTNNHIGSAADLHPDYPATPEGQATFIRDLRHLADSLDAGLIYWGAELVAYKGPQATDGSPYENQALFNFNGVALPALDSLGKH